MKLRALSGFSRDSSEHELLKLRPLLWKDRYTCELSVAGGLTEAYEYIYNYRVPYLWSGGAGNAGLGGVSGLWNEGKHL